MNRRRGAVPPAVVRWGTGVRHFFDELTVTESVGDDGLRRYAPTDGRPQGYAVCADLRVHRDHRVMGS